MASRRFRNTPTRDTPAELAVRREVFRHGLRYRIDARPLVDVNRRADIVFRAARVAVFIDGCYWHGCPIHYKPSAGNREWWQGKIAGNNRRDRDTDDRLRDAGWLPIRIWEHEQATVAGARIVRIVNERLVS